MKKIIFVCISAVVVFIIMICILNVINQPPRFYNTLKVDIYNKKNESEENLRILCNKTEICIPKIEANQRIIAVVGSDMDFPPVETHVFLKNKEEQLYKIIPVSEIGLGGYGRVELTDKNIHIIDNDDSFNVIKNPYTKKWEYVYYFYSDGSYSHKESYQEYISRTNFKVDKK